ncbi:MAG: hypothetical protein COV36_05915 [Alphaproteobacteria bacterium CG11_big_fil_rev_8_21_14_0_20_44_7]|nr:MAG: hypothetical protein COV36_05915 [Alphaproteobacteria bacterium CG11_big_fil_rev_8_21_14_0_20_44_7]
MKKILILSMLGMWAVVAGIIVISLIITPPRNETKTIDQYVKVMNDYIDSQPIDVDAVDDSSDNGKYIKEIAVYAKKVQDIRKAYNNQRRLTEVVIEAQNLGNIESIERLNDTVDELEQVTNESHRKIEEAVIAFVNNINPLEEEGVIFDKEALIKSFDDDAERRARVTQLRLALVQYYRAILEFVESRQGYYKIDSGKIIFDTERDQEYFTQLLLGLRRYGNELDDVYTKEKDKIRDSIQRVGQ